MNKNDLDLRVKISMLIDIYGELLTDKQFNNLKMYFFEDLSLSEIGKINNTSRQSILDSINKSIEQLNTYESKLKILFKDKEIREKKEKIMDYISNNLDENDHKKLFELLENF